MTFQFAIDFLKDGGGQNDRNKQQRIIVKCVRRDMKDKFDKSRGQVREKTTKDLGYGSANRIYLAESLTEQNKDLFRCCLKFKKDNVSSWQSRIL
jgi:hypothetical protein